MTNTTKPFTFTNSGNLQRSSNGKYPLQRGRGIRTRSCRRRSRRDARPSRCARQLAASAMFKPILMTKKFHGRSSQAAASATPAARQARPRSPPTRRPRDTDPAWVMSLTIAPPTSPDSIDQGEIERAQTPFERAAPKHQAQHVAENVKRTGMQETCGDHPPILAALERVGIHGAVTEQQLGRNIRLPGLHHAQAVDERCSRARSSWTVETGDFRTKAREAIDEIRWAISAMIAVSSSVRAPPARPDRSPDGHRRPRRHRNWRSPRGRPSAARARASSHSRRRRKANSPHSRSRAASD